MTTTHLFEQARDIVLGYLGLNMERYTVIFCTPEGQSCSRHSFNLAVIKVCQAGISACPWCKGIGCRAQGAARRRSFPDRWRDRQAGLPRRVIWAHAPDKFEAGTPAIVNVIAFCQGLQLIRHFGRDLFSK